MHSRSSAERILYLFIVPAMAIYLFFYIFPMFRGLYYSMTDWNGFSQVKNFVGLKNYAHVLTDRHILSSIRNTFIYTVLVTSLSNLIGLALALMLERKSRTNNVFRTIFFTPAVFPFSPAMVTGNTPPEELAEAHGAFVDQVEQQLAADSNAEVGHA